MGQQASLLAQLLPEPSPYRPYVHPSQYRCIPNVRHYSDGMHKHYTPNLCTLVIATVTLAAYISIPHMILGLFVSSFFSRTALTGLVILMGSLLIPAKPLRVPPLLRSYLFLCWRRYFKFSYLFEVSLDSYQDYIIAQFPHGAFPFGALLGGTFMACEYPEYPCYALAANAAFWVPIWRHVHAWLGTEACTKHNFHKLLSKGARGPLQHKHHHHHHGHQQQQQQQQEEEQQTGKVTEQQQQQRQQAKSAGGTPFNCTAAALAAAADGVTAADIAATAATPAAAAAAVADSPLGPFASAALIYPKTSLTPIECLVGYQQQQQRGWSPLQRRTNSAPLGQRFSAALSLSSSFLGFNGGHTLSDSDSSESDSVTGSESESEGDNGSWGSNKGCGCGSGLRCRDRAHCAAMRYATPRVSSSMGTAGAAAGMGSGAPIAFVRAYSSDDGTSSSRSSSSSGASVCGCCGASSVLVEVHSLPMDGPARKQQQQQQQQQQQGLLTIPSDEYDIAASAAAGAAAAAVEDAAVDLVDDNSAALPLLGLNQQQQQQQCVLRRRLSSPGVATDPTQQQKQQMLSQAGSPQQQQQQQLTPQSNDPQSNNQESNWRVDPLTGARKLGVSVGLMVGGIAEMFMIRKNHERIKLKDRKGFVRIALEHGTDILPVYMFGVNQALDFGPPWLQRLSRKMRASLGVIYGVWGLPIPRRVPIFMVTGAPLVVGPRMRKDHPGFAARVDELHAQFCVEIERLYYAHRAKYGHGFENRPLVIC